MTTKHHYLLSLDEHFFVAEHPFNVRAVKVKRLCTEIESMEESLQQLYAELKQATEDMVKPEKPRRIRRVRKEE